VEYFIYLIQIPVQFESLCKIQGDLHLKEAALANCSLGEIKVAWKTRMQENIQIKAEWKTRISTDGEDVDADHHH